MNEDTESVIKIGAAAAVPGGGPIVDAIKRKLHERRLAKAEKALDDLGSCYAAMRRDDDDPAAAEWFRKIIDDDLRCELLATHLDDLVNKIIPEVWGAYLALAVDSLSRIVSTSYARDVAALLRTISVEEARQLKTLCASLDEQGSVHEKLRASVSLEERTTLERVMQRMTLNGIAREHEPPPSTLNPGTKRWGVQMIDRGYDKHFERYVDLINVRTQSS